MMLNVQTTKSNLIISQKGLITGVFKAIKQLKNDNLSALLFNLFREVKSLKKSYDRSLWGKPY